jgi:DNA-binding LytR/AlgR family response regulator
MNPKYTTEPKAITHLEADVNYTVVYRECGSKEIVSYTLKRFEELLSDNTSFVRIHKGFIVNKAFIREIKPLNVVLHSGTVLPLARRRKI